LRFFEYFSGYKTFSRNFLELFSHLKYFPKIIKKSIPSFSAQQPKSSPLIPLASPASPLQAAQLLLVAQHPEVHFCSLDSCARSLLLLYPQTLQLPQQAQSPTANLIQSTAPAIRPRKPTRAQVPNSSSVHGGHGLRRPPPLPRRPCRARQANLAPRALAAAFRLCSASPLPLFTTASHRRRPLLESAQGSTKGRCPTMNTAILSSSSSTPSCHQKSTKVTSVLGGPRRTANAILSDSGRPSTPLPSVSHELPSISSTSRAARPNPRWPGPLAIGADRAPLHPDLKEEEGHLLFRPPCFPLIPRSKSCV
jgi:hypothetical protein